MNSITIELCAEDRARLDAILAALTANNQNVPTAEIQPTQKAEKVKAEETKPAEAEAPTEAAEPATEPAPAVSRADFESKVRQLLKDVNIKAKVKEIVTFYAASVSKVPEDKLAEAYGRLTALEG